MRDIEEEYAISKVLVFLAHTKRGLGVDKANLTLAAYLDVWLVKVSIQIKRIEIMILESSYIIKYKELLEIFHRKVIKVHGSFGNLSIKFCHLNVLE